MPRRTTPPLTGLERQRRYLARHPEKVEEHRLLMRKRYAEKRQKQLAERLALVAPANDYDPIAERMKAVTKISTGLTQQELLADAGETLREGSKV